MVIALVILMGSWCESINFFYIIFHIVIVGIRSIIMERDSMYLMVELDVVSFHHVLYVFLP